MPRSYYLLTTSGRPATTHASRPRCRIGAPKFHRSADADEQMNGRKCRRARNHGPTCVAAAKRQDTQHHRGWRCVAMGRLCGTFGAVVTRSQSSQAPRASGKPRMLVIVALSNKMARIIWALLVKQENTELRPQPRRESVADLKVVAGAVRRRRVWRNSRRDGAGRTR